MTMPKGGGRDVKVESSGHGEIGGGGRAELYRIKNLEGSWREGEVN